ncbi:hypothetical protein BCV73_08800 [Paenibacillus sp. SSG-1]|uniref:hypothetical protein n=1 Tax=Paenibacillus sp. SSG-1 TaxID=1443669 RepID=UPI000B8021E0|nr:hypothetical protein [Paenibacillus sp. SSG-1]OXL83166.1 hypothetical protein BCV73_08800 [Paenibacillus sp. SSG-1]
MSDNRDWQADMKRVEDFKFAQTLVNGIQPRFHGENQMPEPTIYALEYWLQQYAAEKQRADIAELAYQGLQEDVVTIGEYQSLLDKHTARTKAYWAEKERGGILENALFTKMEQLSRVQKRLYETEAQVQKLKEALETIAFAPLVDSDNAELERRRKVAGTLLCTLYPVMDKEAEA